MARNIYDCEFTDAKEAEEKCGRKALNGMGGYFEGLGYLVRRGLIDREAVFEVMAIGDIWEKMKPWILKERETAKGGGPALFEHFEYAAEMERAWEAKKKRKGVRAESSIRPD
jgi:hypothetical protein